MSELSSWLGVIGLDEAAPVLEAVGRCESIPDSLEGSARLFGEVYPASHMFTISRGVFNKALGFRDLAGSFWPLLIAVPVITGASILLLRKQER